jgi:hypothetical protein
MKSTYSILSVPIRPEIQERLTIGLVMVGMNSIFFDFSKYKLDIIKDLLPENSYRFLKDYLKQIRNEVDKANKQFGLSLGLFSDVNTELNQSPNLIKDNEIHYSRGIFSDHYLDYLSRYNNNLVCFSSPKSIDSETSEKNFKLLFKNYIDDNEIEVGSAKIKSFDTFKETFYPKMAAHFNIMHEVSFKEIPKLILPVKIDLIGKNKEEVFAQVVDLERHLNHIQNEISDLLFLKEAISRSKGFIISQEPDKKFEKQHMIWQSIRKTQSFTYVDISETEKIRQYAVDHNVKPLVIENTTL